LEHSSSFIDILNNEVLFALLVFLLPIIFGFSPIQRVATALTAMIVVMFLEMVLFIIRAGKFDELDKNRRLRTENNFGPVPSGRRIVAHPPPMLVEEFVDPINKKTN